MGSHTGEVMLYLGSVKQARWEHISQANIISILLWYRCSPHLESTQRHEIPQGPTTGLTIEGVNKWRDTSFLISTTQCKFWTRCIDWRKHNRADHPISYLDTFIKTGNESIEATLRR